MFAFRLSTPFRDVTGSARWRCHRRVIQTADSRRRHRAEPSSASLDLTRWAKAAARFCAGVPLQLILPYLGQQRPEELVFHHGGLADAPLLVEQTIGEVEKQKTGVLIVPMEELERRFAEKNRLWEEREVRNFT